MLSALSCWPAPDGTNVGIAAGAEGASSYSSSSSAISCPGSSVTGAEPVSTAATFSAVVRDEGRQVKVFSQRCLLDVCSASFAGRNDRCAPPKRDPISERDAAQTVLRQGAQQLKRKSTHFVHIVGGHIPQPPLASFSNIILSLPLDQ